MARAVTPAGVQFQVRRHVLLWRPRYRWDMLDADDPITLVLSAVFGLIWLPIELLLDLVLSAVMLVPRLVGLAGWRVTAVSDGRRVRLRWRVRGWSAAGRKVEQVRSEITAGLDPSLHADRSSRRAVGAGGGHDGTHDWTDHHGDGGGSDGGGDSGCGGGCGGGGD
ncbi:hypothetical protein DSM112329_02292 [Paraconexibacter sp. AEG42_29]|uniref:Uncharacterized protein n=1 Tax=Paraconexibacter sp. AEG42_29 TaxID=2997339 RepID=A0AAU7AV22_9ACTN